MVPARLFDKKVLLFDSAIGTALQAAGQPPGTRSEEMNLLAPEEVFRIHSENIEAGSDVVTSNTFGVSAQLLLGKTEHALQCLEAGLRIAREAAGKGMFCLGIGPAGMLLGPLGDVSYEAAEEAYARQAEAGASMGADFILLETFSDAEEFARAARAAIGASGLPVLGTMTFTEAGRTFMGASPADMVRAARESGLAAIGANCSLGPSEIIPIVREIIAENNKGNTTGTVTGKNVRAGYAPLPVIVQPNAGLPACEGGETVYRVGAAEFAAGAGRLLALGVAGIGGCCGTTPAMIAAIRGMIDNG